MEVSRPPSLRERKKLRTFEQVTEVAFGLFERDGFECTSVADIAAAAEVSPRTLFRYFGTKEDILFVRASEFRQALLDLLAQRPANEHGLVAVRQALLAHAEYMEANKEMVARGLRIIESSHLLQRRSAEEHNKWTTGLAQQLADRSGRAEADFEDVIIASIGISILQAAFEAWLEADGDEPLSDLIQRAFLVIEMEFTEAPT